MISFSQGYPGYLTPDRVKAAQYDSFRGIVDDQVDTGHGFNGADVATFTADNAPLHFVTGQGHDRNRGFRDIIRSITLDRCDNDLLGFAIGFFLGSFFHLAQHDSHVVTIGLTGFIQNQVLGIIYRQARDALQFDDLLTLNLARSFFEGQNITDPGVKRLFFLFERFNLAVKGPLLSGRDGPVRAAALLSFPGHLFQIPGELCEFLL